MEKKKPPCPGGTKPFYGRVHGVNKEEAIPGAQREREREPVRRRNPHKKREGRFREQTTHCCKH